MLRFWIFLLLLGLVLAASPASAQQATYSTTAWFPGPTGIGDNTFSGTVDQPGAPNVFSGWVVDTSAQGWSGIDDVQIFNGLMDE